MQVHPAFRSLSQLAPCSFQHNPGGRCGAVRSTDYATGPSCSAGGSGGDLAVAESKGGGRSQLLVPLGCRQELPIQLGQHRCSSLSREGKAGLWWWGFSFPSGQVDPSKGHFLNLVIWGYVHVSCRERVMVEPDTGP